MKEENGLNGSSFANVVGKEAMRKIEAAGKTGNGSKPPETIPLSIASSPSSEPDLLSLDLDAMARTGAQTEAQKTGIKEKVIEALTRLATDPNLQGPEASTAVWGKVNEYLAHPNPAWRRAAVTGFISYQLQQSQSRAGFAKAIETLIDRKYFVEGGPLRLNSKSYGLHPESPLLPDEKRKVGEEFDKSIKKIEAAEAQDKSKAVGKWKTEASSDLDGLRTGKPGQYVIYAPPEPELNDDGEPIMYRDRATGEERPSWKGEGTMLVAISDDGQNVVLLDALGCESIKRTLASAKAFSENEAEVSIPLASLSNSQPPEKIRAPRLLSPKEVYTNYCRCFISLWWWMKRGLRFEEVTKSILASHEKLRHKATLSFDRFLSDRQVPGFVLVDYQGKWDGTISNLFFLLERKAEEGKTAVLRVAEVPPHLEDLLAKCMEDYDEKPEPGFEGCPNPLGAILRAVANLTDKSERVEIV